MEMLTEIWMTPMFLLQALFIVSSIFWISAVITETVMTSNAERSLIPSLRVGFGFLFSIAYFCGVWLVMSIQQGWGLLAVMLAIMLVMRWRSADNKNIARIVKQFANTYIKTFILFLVGSLVFFAPLIISGNYGPFTEGGGDITIYADSAKYLVEENRTALGGTSESVAAIVSNFKDAFTSKDVSQGSIETVDKNRMDPPAAEYQIYRLTRYITHYRLLYIPNAAYQFISHPTNYPVYFGIQAFLYVCILAAIWSLFYPFGIALARISVFTVACSYALISVFYNMYALQAMSIMISALFIAAIPTIRLFSWAGLRTYVPGLIYIWIFYVHFLAIVGFVLAGFTLFFKYPNTSDKIHSSILEKIIQLIIFSFGLLAIWYAMSATINLAVMMVHQFMQAGYFQSSAGAARKAFLGDSVPVFSLHWLTLAFGFLTQQNFYPFAEESAIINGIIKYIGIMAALFVLIAGSGIMLRVKSKKMYLLIYLLALLTVIVQLCIAQSTSYTQAKGVQNIIVYLYIVMLLPFVILVSSEARTKLKRITTIFCYALACFIFTLFAARMTYTAKLAFGHDRSIIVESSYLSEVQKVLQQDNHAYVLVESRKSADLYLTAQPLYGNRMIPTKDLILLAYVGPYQNAKFKQVLGSDLITTSDLSHLWVMHAECKHKSKKWNIKHCMWEATKVDEQQIPAIFIFGAQYEKNYGNRSLTNNEKNLAMFSFIGNGSAMLLLPANGGSVEVTLQPRVPTDYEKLHAEISDRVKKGEFGKQVRLIAHGGNIKLNYIFPVSKASTLHTISQFTGEYWLNAKVNGKDVV